MQFATLVAVPTSPGTQGVVANLAASAAGGTTLQAYVAAGTFVYASR